jgi:hypothetical protein
MRTGEEHRRHPRISLACRVELHDRFATWSCETADIGPRGCQIVTARAPVLGALLGLGIVSDRMPNPLEVAGQVSWVQKAPAARAGISFLGSKVGARAGPADWFLELLGAELAAAAERGEVGPPLAELVVYLGTPSSSEVRAPEERDVLARVGNGVRLADLAARSTSGAVEALLRKGWLTLARASAVAPERWLHALTRRYNRAAERQRAGADPRMGGTVLHALEVPVEVLESAPTGRTGA